VYLGVDGGGTKTAFCLLAPDGTIVSQVRASGIYYFSAGLALVGRVLEEGVRDVCSQAGISASSIRYAFIGLPGYGEASADLDALDAAPRSVLGHGRYVVDNDMVCGWAGSLGASDGINVVSGTGSIAYGVRDGEGLRAGGWSELFGDEGSAYWIAAQGLRAFSKMSDGRMPAGALLEVFRERLALPADLDLIDLVVNRWQGDRTQIAGLCPYVVEAAELGDPAACAILGHAARELALHVDTIRRRLAFPADEPVAVSWSGGTFNAKPLVEAFTRELAALYDGYQLRRPLYTPDVGAAMYAARLSPE
jgi:N-acetylglucosamine kinase-like BadF-type ATPase